MRFTWLEPTDKEWRAYANAWESDVYHLPEYAVAAEGRDPSRIVAALVEGGDRRLLVPLVLREVERSVSSGPRWTDATSPYGYPGPILSPMSPDDRKGFLKAAIPALVDGLSSAGVISVFIRMHPFVGLHAADTMGVGTTVHHGDTVIIDLSQSHEDMWSQTRKGHRYEISRARKWGLKAFPDEDWRHFEQFQEIYAETMGRVEATDNYFFSGDYFHALREALGSHLHLWVVEVGGEIAAASLFTEFNGIVQYHLSGTRTEHLKAQPTKLLLHVVRLWAKARGNRLLHLGGGVGGQQDSLFAFKAGFSKQTTPFHSWRLITNPDAYEGLVRERGFDPELVDPSGFFPAYRRPIE